MRVLLPCDLQMALLSVEMCSLREENERMKTMAEIREPSEQLQSAIRDRDDAIAKYDHITSASKLSSSFREKAVLAQLSSYFH